MERRDFVVIPAIGHTPHAFGLHVGGVVLQPIHNPVAERYKYHDRDDAGIYCRDRLYSGRRTIHLAGLITYKLSPSMALLLLT